MKTSNTFFLERSNLIASWMALLCDFVAPSRHIYFHFTTTNGKSICEIYKMTWSLGKTLNRSGYVTYQSFVIGD